MCSFLPVKSNASRSKGEARQPRPRVTKRREKNRDAARKSRRKQTERADELHEELQHLEQSNSALQKEIAALKKDLRLYEKALERHQPHCRLKDCGSSPAGPFNSRRGGGHTSSPVHGSVILEDFASKVAKLNDRDSCGCIMRTLLFVSQRVSWTCLHRLLLLLLLLFISMLQKPAL
uniref:Basic leucine zipper ATF-like transcription factor 2 n=1 Tax=Fundulus heteroclitus TaxID=8078 RepID=A0A3Q2U2U6_FUNHE